MANLPQLNANLQTVAVANVASSGENALSISTAGQVIRIYAVDLFVGTATAISFKDGAGGTTIYGPGTRTTVRLERMPDNRPYFTLTSGNDFIINLGATNATGGYVVYTKLPA